MSAMSKDQTLVPGEEAVSIVHPHWKVMIRPVAVAVLIVAVVLVAVTVIPFGKATPLAGLVLGAIAVVGVMWSLMIPLLRWWTTTYELTTRRLRVRTGILARRGKDIPLSRVSDVTYQAGILDRLLGSGTLVVEAPGEHGEERLTEIPRVVYLQSMLFQLIEEERQRIARPDREEED
jgi:uncharacterized membrane protein YdbT with pleckstrin-like domain